MTHMRLLSLNICVRNISRATFVAGFHVTHAIFVGQISWYEVFAALFPLKFLAFHAEVNHKETRVMGLSFSEDFMIVA